MIIQFLLFLLPSVSIAQSISDNLYIDCGSSAGYRSNGLDWVPDTAYVYAGTSRNVTGNVMLRTLSTVRTFPNNILRKFCFEIPVRRTSKYLIRTTYYYGGVNGIRNPPVFDQIVDGTLWSVVNTTEEYASGNLSYYEGIFRPTGNNLSVCLAANTYTDSDPFISALEVVTLLDQLYNSTDFRNNSLSLVARHNFGYGGLPIGYPEDQFGRYWEPFGPSNTSPPTSENLAASGMWNLPPSVVFSTRLEGITTEPLTLMWPPGALPVPPQGSRQDYYISLYFVEDLTSVPGGQRIFDIALNGVTYYNNLSVSTAGVSVFANRWPLSGITNLTLTSSAGSSVGPLINAGEVFQVLPAGDRTHPRDVVAIIDLRRSFQNPPSDWHGDPCLPRRYAWTGVTCSYGSRIRIATLNLTSMGLAGSISPSIVNMTGLNTILFGNNSLSGTIPDLSLLRGLQILHLEDNLLTGPIPPLLGNLTNMSEIFLQNNNLTGQVPSDLPLRSGLDLRYSPGNPLLTPPS